MILHDCNNFYKIQLPNKAVSLFLTSTDKISMRCWQLGHRNEKYARLVGIRNTLTQLEQQHVVQNPIGASVDRSIMDSKCVHVQKGFDVSRMNFESTVIV